MCAIQHHSSVFIFFVFWIQLISTCCADTDDSRGAQCAPCSARRIFAQSVDFASTRRRTLCAPTVITITSPPTTALSSLAAFQAPSNQAGSVKHRIAFRLQAAGFRWQAAGFLYPHCSALLPCFYIFWFLDTVNFNLLCRYRRL